MRTPSTGRKKSKAGFFSRARVFSLGTDDDDDDGTVPLVCATCYNVIIVSSSSLHGFDERFVCEYCVPFLLFLKVVVIIIPPRPAALNP